MYKVLLSFLLILLLANVGAQQIDNRDSKAFEDRPFFDQEFIKRNEIKAISGAISFKREGDQIRKQNLVEIFTFDKNGKQTGFFKTHKLQGSKPDTSIIAFEYEGNNLKTVRKSDTYGFFSDNYKYDSLNRIIEKTYCRDENKGKDKFNFELKKQFVIVSENYTYTGEAGKQLTKKHFNNYKRPYKEEVFNWDENGYFLGSKSRTFMGNQQSKITIDYNPNGQVSKKTEQPNLEKPKKIINEYDYDDLGNLKEHRKYKNETQLILRRILYNESTYLMQSQVTKDIKTGLITITKYTYEFYN